MIEPGLEDCLAPEPKYYPMAVSIRILPILCFRGAFSPRKKFEELFFIRSTLFSSIHHVCAEPPEGFSPIRGGKRGMGIAGKAQYIQVRKALLEEVSIDWGA